MFTYTAVPPAGSSSVWAVRKCTSWPPSGRAACVDGPPRQVRTRGLRFPGGEVRQGCPNRKPLRRTLLCPMFFTQRRLLAAEAQRLSGRIAHNTTAPWAKRPEGAGNRVGPLVVICVRAPCRKRNIPDAHPRRRCPTGVHHLTVQDELIPALAQHWLLPPGVWWQRWLQRGLGTPFPFTPAPEKLATLWSFRLQQLNPTPLWHGNLRSEGH